MKLLKYTLAVALVSLFVALWLTFVTTGLATSRDGFTTQDPQAAAGEWRFDVHVPADCNNIRNLEVNTPKPDSNGVIKAGGVIHIECNLMPVTAH